MLHNEARELLVKGYEKSGNVEAISQAYLVSKRTVYRLAQQKRETGSVALRTNQRGRKPALTEEDKISSIRFNGEKVFTTYQGGTTGERFVAYLKDTLLPTLHPGDIVVMDNMRSHHVKAVGELMEEKGIIPLYLPPYSPDLNPIEKMWSKVKAILRNWKIRTLDALPDAIRRALDLVSVQDCQHWFAASFYC